MFNKHKLFFLIISFLILLYFCTFLSAEDKYFSLNEKWSAQLPASINAIKLYDINANNSQDIIIGTSATLHIATDSAEKVISSSSLLPYGINCIEVGDLDQNNIPEILAGIWGHVWIFSDAVLDSYITVPETSINEVVSLKTICKGESTVVYVATSEYQSFFNLGCLYVGTGYLNHFVQKQSGLTVPQEIEFADVDLDDQGELILGDFYWFHMTRVIGTSAHICIRSELPDDTIGYITTLFDFNPYWGIGGGGFTSLQIGNCDSDSFLEVLGSAFVDTCWSGPDSCYPIILSSLDGLTKMEQWRSTYFGTDNIIRGMATVDFNHDGISEVLVAHQNAPMELLNGEDGSKIAESDSSYEVDQFAFGDVDGDGEKEIVIGNGNVLRVFDADFTTDVPDEDKDLSQRNFTILSQNYPNPFNYTTLIPFKVNSSQLTVNSPIPTTLKIYNILGQKVKTLLDEKKILGSYRVIWDGRDEEGNIVPSGIYFYQLTVGNYSESRKMLFLK